MNDSGSKPWALALHGGAGTIRRGSLSVAQETVYRGTLSQITEMGAVLLKDGQSALEVVEAVARVLEDDPLFNAGRGAVFTAEGRNELEAAIMDGATLRAGAVAGLRHTRNPISLARAVMERSPHVVLIGELAEVFGQEHGIERVDVGYFFVERRWRALEQFLKNKNLPLPPRPVHQPAPTDAKAGLAHDEGAQGTIGAVACDVRGNVAVATSTGGTTGKRWGRVGDSPVIGAGTYASNASCAVSATGEGEYFIRLGAARQICALVELTGLPLQAAVDEVVQKELSGIGGSGGVIAVAPDGTLAWSFNTPGMYRARASANSPVAVGIYADDP